MRIASIALSVALAATPRYGLSAFLPSNYQTPRIVKSRPSLSLTDLRVFAETKSEATDIDSQSSIQEKSGSNSPVFMEPVELQENKSNFVNEGLFAWMTPYLDFAGIDEGKSIKNGILSTEIEESARVSDEEAAILRQKAAQNLSNIGMEERERRRAGSEIATVLGIVYVIWVTLLVDNGDFLGQFLRFLSFVPLSVSVGLRASAEDGLWNMVQKGLWDVDGNGMKKIDDPDLARSILKRVNDLNITVGLQGLAIAGAFASLPQSTAATLVSSAILFGGLYAVNGKIPRGS